MVKAHPLAGRYNKYVEYRKTAKKTGSSFLAELKQLGIKPSENNRKFRSDLPQLGRAKTINLTQAHRLARYAPLIRQSAIKHNVPMELICGVILQESGGNARAISRAGAKGLMQLMDGTARRFGVSNSLDPRQNIDGGTCYLRFLLDKFDGKIDLALAAYNAGEQNVEKYGNKIPPFRETMAYVPNVLGYTQAMIHILSPAGPQLAALPAHAKRA